MPIISSQITDSVKELENISTLKINKLTEYKSLMDYKIKAFKKLVDIKGIEFTVKFYLDNFDDNSNAQLFARIKAYFSEPLELFKQYKKTDISDFTKIVKFYTKTYNICKTCGKPTLKTYCSNKCVHNDVDVKNKIKNTTLEKYGCEDIFQNEEFKKHSKETRLEKYGFEYTLLDPLLQLKAQQTRLEKYGTISATDVKEFKDKAKKTCLERYGSEYFVSSKYFPHKKVSKAESDLFDWIPTQNKEQGNRTVISPLELDIYLPDINLAIEYDGINWHSDLYKPKNYHLNKTLKCNEVNITLFHIFETDNIEIWKSMISNKLKLNQKIYARKCTIKELEYKEVKEFLDNNHLQKSCTSKINLGLFYNSELVEVMTFSTPRFNKKYDYELIRLCTKKYTSVVGGASKLFKYFRNKFKGSIVSYANRRFSDGGIYKQLGFTELKASSPNYFYYKDGCFLNRVQCQKHKLVKMLDKFDPNMTEYENMTNNNFLRIYDCGNLVFEFLS